MNILLGLLLLASMKMSDFPYWSHDLSDGTSFQARAESVMLAGSPHGWYGENLYRGECDVRVAVDAWNKSPAHKAILDHDYTSAIIIMHRLPDKCYAIMNAYAPYEELPNTEL